MLLENKDEGRLEQQGVPRWHEQREGFSAGASTSKPPQQTVGGTLEMNQEGFWNNSCALSKLSVNDLYVLIGCVEA